MGSQQQLIQDSIAFLVALGVALALMPAAAHLARRLHLIDRPARHKFHRRPTPYLGGVAVAGAVIAGLVAAGGLTVNTGLILGAGLGLAVIGLLDDARSVGPGTKLAAEAACGVGLWLGGAGANIFGVPVLDLLITILWVVAVVNALNLLDNMDGLAGGVAFLAALTFAFLAAGHLYVVAILAFALAGSTLGFLRFNFPPARIFMGDAGSLFIGFLLAALGLRLQDTIRPHSMGLVVAAVALGVPAFDTALVIAARLRDGRPIYRGATDHSSHRLAALGLGSRNVAFATYAAQLVCSTLAVTLLSLKQGAAFATLALAGICAVCVLLLLLRVRTEPGAHQLPRAS